MVQWLVGAVIPNKGPVPVGDKLSRGSGSVRRRGTRRRTRLLHYDAVRERLGEGRSHLLLGNGWSIGCDEIFRYASLYEAALDEGLSQRAQTVFERLGTNNFEGVMRLLDDAHWVARTYGLIEGNESAMRTDVETVKQALVNAIGRSHLNHTGEVPDEQKDSALRFLEPYHNIFYTNYDLLLYWINMHAGDPPPYEDGFRASDEDPDSPYLVFSERLGDRNGIFYLHGALHMYVATGELRKHSWIRTGRRLTDLIREGLEEGEYPLFVAEGSSEKKIEQIRGNSYLSYCYDKLGRIRNRLVVFGHSLGQSDRHILSAIADNLDLREVYIGIFGDPESRANRSIQAAGRFLLERRARINETRRSPRPLGVDFYDSGTAGAWG